MDEATVRRIVEQYGLEPDVVYGPQKGYRNESYPVRLADDSIVNVMLYKAEPDAENLVRRVNAIGAYVSARKLPARAPRDNRIVKLTGRMQTRYAGLYNYLPGETIAWEAYTQKHIKLLGRMLAELHRACAQYAGQGMPSVTEQYLAIVERMQRYFLATDVAEAIAYKLQFSVSSKVFTRFTHILRNCENLSHKQLLHMDFVRSNILFLDNPELHISGIIDFEKAAYGHPLFDIARTLAFLLVDCKYKSSDKVCSYFLRSGYQKRGKLHIERVTVLQNGQRTLLLDELVKLFLLYDLCKFLRHNPFEFLPLNEHYVRTKDLLLARGVITTTTSV